MEATFAVVRQADQTVLLLPEFRQAALRILGLEGEVPTPDGAASSNRGLYPRFPLGEGRRGILKHYHHGGLLGRLAGDLFFGLRRPFLEFQLSERARRAGIPTSTLIAARVRSVAMLFYRGDVLLLEIPGALDADARAANLLRLGRSFLKSGGDRLQASLARRFLAAYTRGDRDLRRALRLRLQTYPLAFHLHRLGWHLKGAA